MDKPNDVSSDLDELLLRFPSLSFVEEGKKIKCDLTGHEMPSKLEVIQVYVKGKKFVKLNQQQKYNFGKYQPHLINCEDEEHRNHLYCNLTHRFVNRVPEHVERHVKGKRYQRELKRFLDCSKKGIEYKSRRKPQKLNGEKESEAIKAMDQEQLGMDFIPSDSEEGEDDISDESMKDLYPEVDFPEVNNMEEGAETPSGDAQTTKGSVEGATRNDKTQESFSTKITPRVNSSKSKRMRNRKFQSSLHQTRGIKQPHKITKRSKPHRQAERKPVIAN